MGSEMCIRDSPKGKARIRTQMSAGLTREQLDKAIKAFEEARAEIG